MGLGTQLKNVLATVAPVLGSAIGGPMGGAAMQFLADKFTDGDQDKVPDFILSAHPETLKELKLADIEFEKYMAGLGVDLERIAAENTAGAREMAIKTTLMPQITIAAFYLSGYFGVLGYLIYLAAHQNTLSPQLADLIKTLMAAFGIGVPIVLQFFFGSSAGSKDKTIAMAKGGR